MKLAEALLLRKELQGKVARLDRIRETDIAELKVKRISAADSIDEVTAMVPKVTMKDITKEYDQYAKELRLIDSAIQQANWTTDVVLLSE